MSTALALASHDEPPSPDMKKVKKQVRLDLKDIKHGVNKVKKMAVSGGNSRDSGVEALEISEDVRKRARTASLKLRDAIRNAPEGSADKKQLAKLANEIKGALTGFQKNVETAHSQRSVRTDRSSNDKSSVKMGAGPSGGDAPLSSVQIVVQRQSLATDEQQRAIQANDDLLAEREAGIDELVRGGMELKELFEDLNLLISEQGYLTENIQTNLENAASYGRQGQEELESIETIQRRKKKLCCLLAVIASVAGGGALGWLGMSGALG